jgi:triacylglycerol lipase
MMQRRPAAPTRTTPGRVMTRSGLLLGVLLVGAACPVPAAVGPSPAIDRCRAEPDAVILVHGLSRSPRSMRPIAEALDAQGYEVINLDYPSRAAPIEELVPYLDRAVAACCRGRDRYVHFVTHSMGGILVRYYLESRPLDNVGRVVMLSPPNGGSELVDLLRKIPVVRHHIGPSRQELGTDAASLPGRLGPVDYELGVIAGGRSLLPFLSWALPGKDDGVVAVARTRVDGMADFLVVPRGHTWIMRDDEVIRQTTTFLERGAFTHSADRLAAVRP